MINLKKTQWDSIPLKIKLLMFKTWHIHNHYGTEFWEDDYEEADIQEVVETDEGHVWRFTWNDASKAIPSAIDGVLEFPVFTKEAEKQAFYYMDVEDFLNQWGEKAYSVKW